MYWHKSPHEMRNLVSARDRVIRQLKAKNRSLKNNLKVIQTTNDELRNTVKSLRALAHDYITAYEKLTFGDATPEDTPISDIPASP